MLANISELIADVRSLINEPSPSFWTDAEIQRWLLEAADDFATRTKCLSSYYTKVLAESDIINGNEIRVNSDFVALDEGGVYYNGKPLIRVSPVMLREWDINWRNATGTPTHFYLRGDMIGFYPKPSAGDTVSYYGIERPTPMSGDIAPLSGDYRVIALRRYIRDYAVAMCWYKKNEMQKYADMMARYEMGVYNTINILTGHKDQGGRIIPSPGYHRGSTYSVRYGRTDVFD
jgi:hypothetical protein